MTEAIHVDGVAPLEVATRIGFDLARSAIRHGDRCTWLDGALTFPGQNPLVSRTCAADLYGGVTGIGWFLAELAALAPDALLRATARAALRQGAVRANEIGEHGFYGGRAGVGAGLVIGGMRLGDDESVAAGKTLLLALPPAAPAPDATDLVSGLAGSVLALAVAGAALRDGALLDRAGDMADALIAMGDRGADDTLSWPSMGGTRANLPGVAHGTAGIAHALLVLDSLRPDAARRAAAAAAMAYEDACFDPASGGWPDYRTMPGQPPGQIHYPVAWCHGAAGIAQMRGAVPAPPLGSATAVEAGLAATKREVARLLAGPTTDMTLCHGLLGLADALLDAERRGDRESGALLAAIVRHAVLTFHVGERAWPSGLPSREPSGSVMLGSAGIGWFFLRLADPALPSILLPGAHLLRGGEGLLA